MNQEYSRRKRRERLVKGAALLSFCLLSVGFLYLSIFLDQKVLDYPNIVNTLDAVPFLILFVCVISVYNKVYDFANRRMYRQLYSVGVTLFLIQVFMVALPYFGYEFRISKKVMLLSLLLQGAICFLWLGMFRKIYFTAVKPYRVLLIEGSWDAESIRLKFLFSSRKYRIEKILEEGEEGMGEAIREYGVVMLSNVSERTKEEVIAQCSREQKKVIIRPKASDILLVNAGVEQIDDLLLVSSRRLRLRKEQELVKRCMDVLVSLPLLLLSSPLILVSALLVYMEDRENPFFTQERLTKGGEKFQIYKLRTMKAGSEKEIGLAKKGDARITKVGKVLRKYRIDELPQLLNVLKGEMSLIGPRPEREYYYRLYDKTMPEFRYRLNVKAGLSGYAQVWGRYNTKLREKLMMDLMYIQDYSFLLDIKLMLETIRVVFDHRSSEGVE